MPEKRPTYRIDRKKHKQLMHHLIDDELSFQEFADWCVSQYLAGNIKPKGRIEMLREKLAGNHVIVGAEWLEKNDPDQLDWIMDSEYCDFERGETVLEIQFRLDDMHEILYYACASDAPDADRPSRNQHPWGEDSWEDWERQGKEYLQAYAELI